MSAQQETAVRLGVFLGVLILVAAVETVLPRKQRTCSRKLRWTNNLLLSGLNTLAVRFLLPLSAVAVAEIAQREQWGILHLFNLPSWANILIAIVSLDLLIYFQHLFSHSVPLFWRVHRVHHADHDIDVTTGLRFHPIEILASMLIKMAAIILLGASPLAVMIFEILLNATAMFNHGNIKLPKPLDRFLRLFLVTPDMHRIHHSQQQDETDSNFGFNLTWWDHLFRTYRAEPQGGHDRMKIGLPEFPGTDVQRLDVMLSLPLKNRSPVTGQPEMKQIDAKQPHEKPQQDKPNDNTPDN